MKKIKLQVNLDDESKETAEVYVEGKIEGKPCKFLFDTACAKTTLSFDSFSSQFETIGSQESSGIFGRTEYDLISVDWIDIHGAIIKNNMELARAKKGGLDRNLLGMDLLKDQRLAFSFNEELVEVNPQQDKSIKSHDLILDNKFIPHINLVYDSKNYVATWDTGASITLVDTNFIDDHPTMFKPIGAEVGTDSTNAKEETPLYIMEPIIIGNKKFPRHKVASVPLTNVQSASGMSMNFILGFSTLRNAKWLFDFPQRKWSIPKML